MSVTRRDFITNGALAILAATGITTSASTQPIIAHAKTNGDLSSEAIANRFEEIRNRYAIGDCLSESDSAFVSKYATSQNIVSRGIGGNSSFYFTASTVDAYATAQGYAYHNGTLSYTYGADVTVSNQTGGIPSWMKFEVVCDSYGVGQNGATTFEGSHSCSHSVNAQNSFYANLQDGYSGYTVYWNLTLKLSGSSASGNYFSAAY